MREADRDLVDAAVRANFPRFASKGHANLIRDIRSQFDIAPIAKSPDR